MCAHVFQEAAADLAEVRLVFVELLLQALEELPLEAVDVLDVPEDGAQLLLCEHVRPLAALLDVTLQGPRVRGRTQHTLGTRDHPLKTTQKRPSINCTWSSGSSPVAGIE